MEPNNPRVVPYPQWGGSGQYAHRLVGMLPAHDTYVEPFCGAAALFFSKLAVAKEVLADLDPEVTFTLQYIQSLTAQRLNALRRFPWRVSRRGHRRAQRAQPVSDSERVWRNIYCRWATWGAKPTCHGFASVHEGRTYDLNELWRFKKRLQGTTILTQDWRQTLRDHRGDSAALFFIDPPYEKEWSIAPGVPPEEIAEEVRSLKGHYLIAYTDSPAARRAFADSGHQFTLQIRETRRTGMFVTASRLFVRSWESDWLSTKDIVKKLCHVARSVSYFHLPRENNFVWPRLSMSVDWQTPPDVVKALGKFDLDPCASTRQAFRTARVMWNKRQDGLSREWFGRVWLNPPFDPHLLPKFLSMMVEHNNGIALVPVSVTTKWWKNLVWPYAHSILFLHEKLVFYRGKRRSATPRSHMDRSEALVAFGRKNTTALKRSRIAGQLVVGIGRVVKEWEWET